MSTGQRHGYNKILVLDRNLDYPALARWPTYFANLEYMLQPSPPDDFANLCFGFCELAQLFCELVFWGFANLRNYFANLCFGVLRTCATILRTCVLGFARVKPVREADRHVLRQIPSIGIGAQHGRSQWTFAIYHLSSINHE